MANTDNKNNIDNQEYIISQYSNSPTIKSILNYFSDDISTNEDISSFLKNIMDIDTANGVGLDVLGRIIGIPRTAPFYDGTSVTLNDEDYRDLLKFKALANISDSTMENLCKATIELYKNRYQMFVLQKNKEGTLANGDKYNTTPMQVRFVWRANSITNVDRVLFYNGMLALLAAGVGWDVLVVSEDPIFGFCGSELNPFNQGVFVTLSDLDYSNILGFRGSHLNTFKNGVFNYLKQ
nr:MAG TPA: Protein of unknown function (DUF2612) [Caudoviricetes sp.]